MKETNDRQRHLKIQLLAQLWQRKNNVEDATLTIHKIAELVTQVSQEGTRYIKDWLDTGLYHIVINMLCILFPEEPQKTYQFVEPCLKLLRATQLNHYQHFVLFSRVVYKTLELKYTSCHALLLTLAKLAEDPEYVDVFVQTRFQNVLMDHFIKHYTTIRVSEEKLYYGNQRTIYKTTTQKYSPSSKAMSKPPSLKLHRPTPINVGLARQNTIHLSKSQTPSIMSTGNAILKYGSFKDISNEWRATQSTVTSPSSPIVHQDRFEISEMKEDSSDDDSNHSGFIKPSISLNSLSRVGSLNRLSKYDSVAYTTSPINISQQMHFSMFSEKNEENGNERSDNIKTDPSQNHKIPLLHNLPKASLDVNPSTYSSRYSRRNTAKSGDSPSMKSYKQQPSSQVNIKNLQMSIDILRGTNTRSRASSKRSFFSYNSTGSATSSARPFNPYMADKQMVPSDVLANLSYKLGEMSISTELNYLVRIKREVDLKEGFFDENPFDHLENQQKQKQDTLTTLDLLKAYNDDDESCRRYLILKILMHIYTHVNEHGLFYQKNKKQVQLLRDPSNILIYQLRLMHMIPTYDESNELLSAATQCIYRILASQSIRIESRYFHLWESKNHTYQLDMSQEAKFEKFDHFLFRWAGFMKHITLEDTNDILFHLESLRQYLSKCHTRVMTSQCVTVCLDILQKINEFCSISSFHDLQMEYLPISNQLLHIYTIMINESSKNELILQYFFFLLVTHKQNREWITNYTSTIFTELMFKYMGVCLGFFEAINTLFDELGKHFCSEHNQSALDYCDILINPVTGYALRALVSIDDTPIDIQNAVLGFLANIFKGKPLPEHITNSYIRFHFLNFVQLYNNVDTEDMATLCANHLNVLIELSSLKIDRVRQKFFKLNLMEFLVREIELEHVIETESAKVGNSPPVAEPADYDDSEDAPPTFDDDVGSMGSDYESDFTSEEDLTPRVSSVVFNGGSMPSMSIKSTTSTTTILAPGSMSIMTNQSIPNIALGRKTPSSMVVPPTTTLQDSVEILPGKQTISVGDQEEDDVSSIYGESSDDLDSIFSDENEGQMALSNPPALKNKIPIIKPLAIHPPLKVETTKKPTGDAISSDLQNEADELTDYSEDSFSDDDINNETVVEPASKTINTPSQLWQGFSLVSNTVFTYKNRYDNPLLDDQLELAKTERNLKSLYLSDTLHVAIITLIISLSVNECDTLDRYYYSQHPSLQNMRNIPVLLYSHLNDPKNVHLIGPLTERVKKLRLGCQVLLKLCSKSLFDPQLYRGNMEKLLGHGAFGKVYLTKIDASSEKVAVKLMDRPKTIHGRCVAHDSFTEIVIMEKFKHTQHICLLYDYGLDDDSFYIVMKRYSCSLKSWREKQTKPLADMLPIYMKIFQKVMLAVKKLNESNINHFDLKCDNVFLEAYDKQDDLMNLDINNMNFEVIIGDFGESMLYPPNSEGYTMDHRGTKCIKSPEMISIELHANSGTYDRRRKIGANNSSDMWSLGCLFFELLTGDFLFDAEDFTMFLEQLTNDKMDLFRDEARDLLEGNKKLESILSSILIRDPNRRPSIYDLLQQYDQWEIALKCNEAMQKEKQPDELEELQDYSKSLNSARNMAYKLKSSQLQEYYADKVCPIIQNQIYLGGESIIHDRKLLNDNHFTHIVDCSNVSHSLKSNYFLHSFVGGSMLEYKKAFKFMMNALFHNGKIVVFPLNRGVQVIAYCLRKLFALNYFDIVMYLKHCHPGITQFKFVDYHPTTRYTSPTINFKSITLKIHPDYSYYRCFCGKCVVGSKKKGISVLPVRIHKHTVSTESMGLLLKWPTIFDDYRRLYGIELPSLDMLLLKSDKSEESIHHLAGSNYVKKCKPTSNSVSSTDSNWWLYKCSKCFYVIYALKLKPKAKIRTYRNTPLSRRPPTFHANFEYDVAINLTIPFSILKVQDFRPQMLFARHAGLEPNFI